MADVANMAYIYLHFLLNRAWRPKKRALGHLGVRHYACHFDTPPYPYRALRADRRHSFTARYAARNAEPCRFAARHPAITASNRIRHRPTVALARGVHQATAPGLPCHRGTIRLTAKA